MTDKNTEKNIHKDHRKKVKSRFYSCGFDGMADHNVLEMLLFFGIPMKDTNIIAHELIEKFGSFSGVLEAGRTDIAQIKGMTENAACLISMILPLYRKYMDDVMNKKPSLMTNDEIVEFLRPHYLDSRNERVYLLCFDPNHKLLAFRKLSEGDIDSSKFDIRKLASIVLETNCSSVVLSHNHPHGIPTPSLPDVEITKQAYEFLKQLKVRLLDHIIITEESYFSMLNSVQYTHIFYGLPSIYDGDDD